jgi:hypothetical protein
MVHRREMSIDPQKMFNFLTASATTHKKNQNTQKEEGLDE